MHPTTAAQPRSPSSSPLQSGKKARYEQATEKYKLFQQKKDRINKMDSILTVSSAPQFDLFKSSPLTRICS